MKFSTKVRSVSLLLIVVCFVLVACSSGKDEAETPCADLANVEGVTVEQRSDGAYAVVSGYYPDACTRVSNVDQEVQVDKMEITICTASPPGLMCAQMITPFELEILLETGGLESGEYTVAVNGIASAAFTIE
ncbi:MAG: hypothetical protein U9R58_03950 [Chloroflexota bacterium]|nr:hypothetical protein [Chloroflexota bacterium]